MIFHQYSDYEAVFTPRDNERYRLKPEVRQFIGQRFLFRCYGPIDAEDRPKYAGENEFVLHMSRAMPQGFPGWVAEKDLTDIQEVAP